MNPTDRRQREDQIRRFFKLYPDYWLCRTLLDNIREQTTTESEALRILGSKAQASQENREEIEDRLNRKTVRRAGRNVLVRSLSLRAILDLDDQEFREVVRFYFKHPYAHERTPKARWIPNLLRTFFLRVLLGNARDRDVDVDYQACFEILRLL